MHSVEPPPEGVAKQSSSTGREDLLISVVVPFFNSERHLEACIQSLLAQKLSKGHFEIVLVDNGSADGSRTIAERFADVVLVDEPKQGAYAARNTGLRATTAELIAFTDADCVAAPGWLQTIIDAMNDRTIGILLGRCDYPHRASFALRSLARYENAKTAYVLERCESAHHFGYTNNMAVRTELLEHIGPFLLWQRAADSELVHRAARVRPDLRTCYRHDMRITHREFLRLRDRLRRLALYTETNSKIETFRELRTPQRLAVVARMLRSMLANIGPNRNC